MKHLTRTSYGVLLNWNRVFPSNAYPPIKVYPACKSNALSTILSFHNSSIQSRNTGADRPMPSVYYYQNPLQWLKIRWQFLKLKKWDNDFNERDFTRGSTQAVSVVTRIVHDKKLDDLEDLLTPFALSKLRRDVLALWNDDIVRNIGLRISDIKLAVPTRVKIRTDFVRQDPKKMCDIDMWFMAMKWTDLDALLVIDLVTRFNRDLTQRHGNAGWTISFFELRKYHVQPQDRYY